MRLGVWLCAAACAFGVASLPVAALAAEAPTEIKIGSLYANSGAMASTSAPMHVALQYWVDGQNKQGGVFVKGFGKRIRSSWCPMTTKAPRRWRAI